MTATPTPAPLLEDELKQLQQRLFGDPDACVELRIQAVLARRRSANASGQEGEDIGNIRAAIASEAKG